MPFFSVFYADQAVVCENVVVQIVKRFIRVLFQRSFFIIDVNAYALEVL